MCVLSTISHKPIDELDTPHTTCAMLGSAYSLDKGEETRNGKNARSYWRPSEVLRLPGYSVYVNSHDPINVTASAALRKLHIYHQVLCPSTMRLIMYIVASDKCQSLCLRLRIVP